MPSHTAQAAYSELLEVLRAQGRGWVADQVQEQVRAGKPITKKVFLPQRQLLEDEEEESVSEASIESDTSAEPVSSRETRREHRAATEDYSAEERLDLVIASIEAAMVQPADIERNLVDFFESMTSAPAMIRFEPDEFDDSAIFTLQRPPKDRDLSLERLRASLAGARSRTTRDGNR